MLATTATRQRACPKNTPRQDEAVDLYASEAEAVAALEEAHADEPAWVDDLYVEPVEFPLSEN